MTESYVYSKYPDDIQQKLDFGTYHPERLAFYQRLENSAKRLGYDLDDLENLVFFVKEEINPKRFPDAEFNYLGLENIESNTGRVTEYQKLRGRSIRSTSKAFRLGCIVFSRLRPYLNKVHLVKISHGIGSGELYVIRPKKDRIKSQFLLRYLLSDLTLRQTKWILSGSSYPRLDKDEFAGLKILFPRELSDQERIVKAVTRIEKESIKYERKASQIRNKNRNLILRALNVRMPRVDADYFAIPAKEARGRLDYIWNHPLTNAIMNMLNEKYAIPLGNLVEDPIDYGVNAFGKEEGETPFINVQNLRLDGTINTENIAYVDRPAADKLLRKGDVLISRSRTVGTCGLIEKEQEDYTFGSYILRMRIRNDAEVLPMYVVSYINSDLGQAQIRFLQTGSRGIKRGGGNNINPDQVKQISILLPEKFSKQKAMVKKLLINLNQAKKFEEMSHQEWKKSRNIFKQSLLI